MLKGISPAISPALLAVLSEMGHGDEIVLADAHFPGRTFNSRVLRADGRVGKLGHIAQVEMGAGDVFEIQTPGGGGFGST